MQFKKIPVNKKSITHRRLVYGEGVNDADKDLAAKQSDQQIKGALLVLSERIISHGSHYNGYKP